IFRGMMSSYVPIYSIIPQHVYLTSSFSENAHNGCALFAHQPDIAILQVGDGFDGTGPRRKLSHDAILHGAAHVQSRDNCKVSLQNWVFLTTRGLAWPQIIVIAVTANL